MKLFKTIIAYFCNMEPAPASWGVKHIERRKKVFIPTDSLGKPDYENIRTSARPCRMLSRGKIIKAFIYY